MPAANRATLRTLLSHLLRVTELQEHNRMQIPNLAIVFGPTLMWPPPAAAAAADGGGGSVSASHAVAKTHNLALDMMQQNIIVETLLNSVQLIF